MQSFQNTYLKAMLASLVLLPIAGTTKEIVVETETGESYVLHVGKHDTFDEVFESIAKVANVNASEFRVMSASQPLVLKVAKTVRSAPRSFEAGITQANAADITYILRTLANSSLPRIKAEESSLKKAGQRIDDIHPLHFLGYIFSNEELKVCARNIKGRSWVWKGFLNGSVVTLTEEQGKNNVLPHLNEFAARVNIDANLILPSLQAGRWEKFVTTLIDAVPRESGGNRYDC